MRIYSSTITGSLKVKGDVHAENYIVQSTVTQVTRSFASGSSIFGDDVLDTHQFTGSILSSGSANFDGSLMVTSSALTVDVDGGVSGSSTSTGSFGNLQLVNQIQIGSGTTKNLYTNYGSSTAGLKVGYARTGFLSDTGAGADGDDAEIVMTGAGGSAPFDNHGSIVYKTRAVDAIARSSHIFYTGKASAERVRIDHDGNVGIGTASPDHNLHVSSSGTVDIVAESQNFGIKLSADNDNSRALILLDRDSTDGVGAGSDYSYIRYDSAGLDIGTGENLPIVFEPNGTERVRITTAGIILNSSAAHVSGSQYSTGSFGSVETAGNSIITGNLNVGAVGASSAINLYGATNGNPLLIYEDTDNSLVLNFYLDSSDNAGLALYANGQSQKVNIGTVSSNPTYFLDANVGIGATSPKTHLDVQSYQADGITIGADNDTNRTRTNSTTKSGGITGVHYTNAEESIRLIGYSSISDANKILIGGGNGDWNAATQIDFYTAANFNTVTGTKTLTIAPNTISGSSTSTGSFGVLTLGTADKYETFAGHIQGTKGLRINHTGTTWDAQAIRIDSTITTGRGVGIEGSSLTTGNLLFVYSNSSDTSDDYMALFHQDHASAAGRVPIGVQQEANIDGIRIIGKEGKSGILGMWADDGDDNNDKWRFVAQTGGQFSLQSYAGGSWASSFLADQDNTKLHIFENLDLSSGDFDISGSATSTGSFGRVMADDYLQVGSTVDTSHAIHATGHVGMTGTLHLASSQGINWAHGDASIVEGGSSNYAIDFYNYDGSGNNLTMTLKGNHDVVFPAANAKISGSSTSTGSFGMLGINESSPDEALHITSTAASATPVILLENSNANNLAPQLNLYNNSASPDDGDYVGQIDFEGNDSGDNRTQYARIIAQSIDVTNTIEDGILDLQTMYNGTLTTGLRLRGMDGGAFVGIGETNPDSKLHIKGSDNTNSKITIENTNTSPDNVWSIHANYNSQALMFNGDSTTVMTMLDTGNVGIGTTNPGSMLHVYKNNHNWVFIDAADDKSAGIKYAASGSYANWFVGDYSAHKGNFSFYDLNKSGGAGVQVLIESGSGNVGIGTTNPSDPLHVYQTSGATIRFQTHSSYNSDWRVGATSYGGGYSTGNAFAWYSMVSNAYVMTISGSGNVGIGVENPIAKLQIGKSSATGLHDIRIENSSAVAKIGVAGGGSDVVSEAIAGDLIISNYTGGTKSILFGIGTAEKMRVDHSGNVGIGTTIPEGLLHIHTADASIAPNADGDELVVENSGNAGISILSGNTSNGAIFFGDAQDNNVGIIDYDHNVNQLSFTVAANKAMTINASRNIGIGTTAPVNLLHLTPSGGKGLTISGSNTRFEFKDDSGYQRIEAGVSTNVSFASFIQMRSMNNVLTTQITAGGGDSFISSGSFGIGSTAPTDKLYITDGASAYTGQDHRMIQLKRNATNSHDDNSFCSMLFSNNSNGFTIGYGGTTDRFRFIDGGGVERVSILNGGDVGIGTTSPSVKLQVEESTNGADVQFNMRALNDSGTGRTTCIRFDPDERRMHFGEDVTNLVLDTANVRVGIGNNNPNHKLHVSGSGFVGAAVQSSGSAIGMFSDDNNGRSYLLLDDAVSGHSGFGSGTDYTTLERQNGTSSLIGYGTTGGFQIGNYSSDEIDFITNNTRRMTIEAGGAVEVVGALSKGSGTFRIPHPVPEKKDKLDLQHSFVESPTRGDNIYRWQVEVKNNQHIIELPDYYQYLNENDMVWVNPVNHFGRGYGNVNDEQTELTITTDTDGLYNVLLIGTRKDETAMNNFKGVEVERKEETFKGVEPPENKTK